MNFLKLFVESIVDEFSELHDSRENQSTKNFDLGMRYFLMKNVSVILVHDVLQELEYFFLRVSRRFSLQLSDIKTKHFCKLGSPIHQSVLQFHFDKSILKNMSLPIKAYQIWVPKIKSILKYEERRFLTSKFTQFLRL